MIAFLTILYGAAVFLVFSVMRVRPRPWPIAAFVAAGIVLIGGIVVLWTLAAPISKRAVVSRFVVQIVPWVKGKVQSIEAKPNVVIKKGDVLFQIDPATYQYSVNQAQARLQSARSNVQQLEAGVQLAQATIKKAEADLAAGKFAYEADVKLQKANAGAVSELKVSQDRAEYLAAEASLLQATASLNQSEMALAAAKDAVLGAQAELETARFNLGHCTVTAPANGFVTDWMIREESMANPVSAAAVGAFVDTSETFVVASFPAETLIHVRPGQKVELAVKSRPGELFLGRVECVIQASGEGQFAPTGKLPSAAQVGSPGFLAVRILLNDEEAAAELEMGAPCAVAIYTDWGKPFALISKVAIRMQKWLYFVPLP
jgi:multidrug resistance efflux pump